MADPRNSGRGRSAVTADDFARAYASQPHSAFPAHRQYFDESEDDDHMQSTADADKEVKEKKVEGDRSHELRRDEMQYRTALKTAFELGHKAGLMQRNEIPPCSACERRKERNRIAAQASRMEKRRLERGADGTVGAAIADSSASVETVVRAPKRRLPTAGVPPEPFHAPAPSYSNASAFVHPPRTGLEVEVVRAAPEEDEDEDEGEIEPPPF